MARKPLRDGVIGAEIYTAVEPLMQRLTAGKASFVAHGMGLISHEAPRLTASGPWPYSAFDRDRTLPAGMVVSSRQRFSTLSEVLSSSRTRSLSRLLVTRPTATVAVAGTVRR